MIFNSLSWADDLVIISQSKIGLQNCLDKLKEYCKKWQLNVNIDKTKIMILSPGNAHTKDIVYDGTSLECVSTYKYLGLIFSSNGNIGKMEDDRIDKARKASFAIRQAISTSHNISVKLALSLFDKQIEPILLYGCPIWGLPSSNSTIRLKCDSINTKQLKNDIYLLLRAIDITDIDIISCRYCKSRDDTLITLNNIVDKIKILDNFSKFPVTFEIINNDSQKYSEIETFYNKYCKFTLGISKYASNILTLGEIGKYPIQIKSVVLGILYWLRMEHGTENVLLNHAFLDMKAEKHAWLQNVQYFLYTYGLGDVWTNPHLWDTSKLKQVITRRLKDIFIQKYNEYIHDEKNNDKCKIVKKCVTNVQYKAAKYLDKIKSPSVRSVFTKFRLDINNTQDCKNRSFRYKHIASNLCINCNEAQDVYHILFKCKINVIDKNRKIFYERYSKYVKDFSSKQEADQLKEIFMLNPACADEYKEKAFEVVCNYVKILYSLIGNLGDQE